MQSSWAAHERFPPVGGDAGSHARELGHVLESVFVDRLRDDARALGLGHERHILRLQVGGKAWVRPGEQVDRAKRPAQVSAYCDRAFGGLDLRACFLKLQQYRGQVLLWSSVQDDLSPCRS